MDIDRARSLISTAGYEVTSEERLGNGLGTQLRVSNGSIVTVYDTGRHVLGGKNTDDLKASFEAEGPSRPSGTKPTPAARKVFVVYGHDTAARTELEAMLRRWGLDPLILDQLPSGGQTIIEKLESVRAEASYAVVLVTADDEGHRAGHPDEKALRARQNVVLELGMMLAVLGRERVAILLPSNVSMERPSDIQGLIYISYKDNVKEAALTLAKEINAAGIRIDLSKV